MQPRTISFQRDSRGVWSWILNILWLVLGGWHMFLTWFTTGLLICATIVGIPCGWQVIKISVFLLFPFGKTMVYTGDELEGGAMCCMSCCNCLLNVLWALTAGWILALQAFFTGIAFCLTIIGIPFGWQCFRLMVICFRPFGIDFTAEETVTLPASGYQHMSSPAMQTGHMPAAQTGYMSEAQTGYMPAVQTGHLPVAQVVQTGPTSGRLEQERSDRMLAEKLQREEELAAAGNLSQ